MKSGYLLSIGNDEWLIGLKKYHYKQEEFLFRNTSMLTCSGLRQDLNFVTVSPAVENTLSAGMDVAGMHKYFLVTCATKGKRFRNTSMFTCSGLKQYLNFVTASPAVESTLSAGVDVAGMHKYFLATKRKQCSLGFHHSSGDVSQLSCRSCRLESISFMTGSDSSALSCNSCSSPKRIMSRAVGCVSEGD